MFTINFKKLTHHFYIENYKLLSVLPEELKDSILEIHMADFSKGPILENLDKLVRALKMWDMEE